MVEFGHEVIKFGQKLTYWLKKQPFCQEQVTFCSKHEYKHKKAFVYKQKLACRIWSNLSKFEVKFA